MEMVVVIRTPNYLEVIAKRRNDAYFAGAPSFTPIASRRRVDDRERRSLPLLPTRESRRLIIVVGGMVGAAVVTAGERKENDGIRGAGRDPPLRDEGDGMKVAVVVRLLLVLYRNDDLPGVRRPPLVDRIERTDATSTTAASTTRTVVDPPPRIVIPTNHR